MLVTARRNSSDFTSRAYASPPSCVRARSVARIGDVSIAAGPACFCIRSNFPIVVPSSQGGWYVGLVVLVLVVQCREPSGTGLRGFEPQRLRAFTPKEVTRSIASALV